MSLTFEVFTLFPEAISGFVGTGLLGKAVERELVRVHCTNYRDFAQDRRRTVDDAPFGGGAGMVIQPGPVVAAMEHVQATRGAFHSILLTPSAPRFDQAAARRLATLPRIGLLCGRYEGIDDRVREHFVDECFSIGDFVLGGGEVAALVVIEAVSRLEEGVLGNPESAVQESFTPAPRGMLLEHPQYTRPASFRGYAVPEVLQAGNHAAIEAWRLQRAVARTWEIRPELRPVRPAPAVPWYVLIPPSHHASLELLEVAVRRGLAGVVLWDPTRERLRAWQDAARARLEVFATRSRSELRRLLRREHGRDPWWIELDGASAAHDIPLRRSAAVWDQLALAGDGAPGALLVALPGLPAAPPEQRRGWPSAWFAPIQPEPTPHSHEKSDTEGLATEAAIADASRPPLQLARWVEHALADLQTR